MTDRRQGIRDVVGPSRALPCGHDVGCGDSTTAPRGFFGRHCPASVPEVEHVLVPVSG